MQPLAYWCVPIHPINGKKLIRIDKIRCINFLFTGSCAPSNAAVRFGKTSYKYAQLQVHWTNPRKRTDWYDSSGIRIFYTPKLRPNDIGTMTVGQLFLDIPGGKSEVILILIC